MNARRILRVRDMMQDELHSIDGLATVSEAMALMCRHHVSSLAVPRRRSTCRKRRRERKFYVTRSGSATSGA